MVDVTDWAAPTVARNASLADLAGLLQRQHTRKLDVVAPASAIRADGGRLVIRDSAPVLSADGVTRTEGAYAPTALCDEGIAAKLGIPLAYLRRMRAEHVGLYDANVNGWLACEDRSFLVRCFGGDAGSGIARAFLSNRYGFIDNLDVLTAALDGVRRSGAAVRVDGCDLTERSMYVRVVSEQVRALAPALLHGYTSPFTGERGADNPIVWAGFVISNSETGRGAFTITPRLVVQVCRNGLTITRDAMREVHLGGRIEAGIVQWSPDTLRASLDLVTAKTTDAVATFLSRDYLDATMRELQAAAGHPISDPAQTVHLVCQRLRFTDAQQADILSHFIRGGSLTACGVMHAVTSAAQLTPDGDAADRMECHGVEAMRIAARL